MKPGDIITFDDIYAEVTSAPIPEWWKRSFSQCEDANERIVAELIERNGECGFQPDVHGEFDHISLYTGRYVTPNVHNPPKCENHTIRTVFPCAKSVQLAIKRGNFTAAIVIAKKIKL